MSFKQSLVLFIKSYLSLFSWSITTLTALMVRRDKDLRYHKTLGFHFFLQPVFCFIYKRWWIYYFVFNIIYRGLNQFYQILRNTMRKVVYQLVKLQLTWDNIFQVCGLLWLHKDVVEQDQKDKVGHKFQFQTFVVQFVLLFFAWRLCC